jgi:hypothetical protein
MANIFTLENVEDFSEKLNIDDLYEKKRQHDLTQLALFNKLLNRIHVKIKTISRQKIDEQFCWFVVPEIMIGVPKYDQGACIAYLMDKLSDNGFAVRYTHPNALFICWKHWVPSYVRTELKKKTGIVIDEFGNKVSQEDGEAGEISFNKNKNQNNGGKSNSFEDMMFKRKDNNNMQNQKPQKKFTPINSYKPQGALIYNEDLLNSLEDKFI